jgi:hypothetical protein
MDWRCGLARWGLGCGVGQPLVRSCAPEGDGEEGEEEVEGVSGEADVAQALSAIASFEGAEHAFDPAADPADGLVAHPIVGAEPVMPVGRRITALPMPPCARRSRIRALSYPISA